MTDGNGTNAPIEEEQQQALLDAASALAGKNRRTVLALARRLVDDSRIHTHYYVKICVSVFLCALLLLVGVPVFMESRVTGSLAYTALGVVLVGFGLVLAVAAVVLLFRPPFQDK